MNRMIAGQGVTGRLAPVSGGPTGLREGIVRTVEPDGTVSVEMTTGRAGVVGVPVPAWYAATLGDHVLVGELNGNPASPIVVAPLSLSEPTAGANVTTKKYVDTSISSAEVNTVGGWQNLTFGAHTEAGSHIPQVREEAKGLLRFTGALYIKAELVPTENEGPVLANSPIQFKGGGSGFIYATAIRYNSVGKKHESGVVIECEDGTNDIRLAGGPTLVDGDQVDLDGIALKLR